MNRYSVALERFDGGLNSKVTPINGTLDQSPDLYNVIFDDLGAVETRRGYSYFNTAAIATQTIDGLHSFSKNNGNKELLAWCNGSAFRASGTTFVTVPSAQSVYTAGQRVLSLTYQNKVFFSNGYSTPYKYDGTDFVRWGVSVPTSSISGVTINSDGVLTGAYTYKVLGMNTFGVKGDFATASTEITVASKQIQVNGIWTWPTSHGVQHKVLCRNTAGVSNLYYIVTQLTAAQTSYIDNNPDSYLITEAPLDNGVPSNFTCMVQFQNRIFAAAQNSTNPMFLWYSNIDDPEIFPSDSIIKVGEGDGAPITGLAILSNALIISKNDGKGNGSLWLLYMPDANPDNWSLTKLDTESSSQSAKVMVNFSNYIAFLNRYGIYDLDQQATGTIKADPLSFNIEPDIYALAVAYLSAATAITWKNKVWFSVPYGASQPSNNRVYQYDYVRGRGVESRDLGAWSRFDNHDISEFAVHDGNLYGGSSKQDGFVYKLDTGYNDAGDAIESYFKTMPITGMPEHQSHTKVWRFAYITVECSGEWMMTLSYSNDFKDETGNTAKIDLDPESSLWDSAVVGVDKWGPGYFQKRVKVTFRGSTSKALQLKFSTNTADQYFKVHKVEVYYNLRGMR
jgi:hypothetical protein